MAVAGVPPIMFVTVGLIDLLYQYWVHTELVGRLGWFDRVFVSPSNHRVHHGQNDYCIDKNYGGILIVWDRLFGTFVDEREGEKIHYGIRKPLRSFNPVWGNLHYYADLWRASCAAVGWRAKLGVWLAPPGGWNVPLEHFEGAHFTRYQPTAPGPLRWYVALQYAVSVPFVTHCIAVAPTLPLAQAAAYALGILASSVCLGALLEGRGWARWAEAARVALLGMAFALVTDWFGFVAPDALRWTVLLFGLGSAFYLLRFGASVSDGGARMNPDALSDLVLLAACAASAWRVAVVRAAWRGAMLLLGLAAAMGVLRYSGLEWALGPHRFFSLLAACVAFWLMVAALRWPQAPLARQATAVGRFVVLLGGLGIAASQVGAAWWAQVVPGLSALVLAWTMVQQRSALGLLGRLPWW
jgi:hypothetical protein